MRKPVLPRFAPRSRTTKDRLYWTIIGVLVASIVWLPLSRAAWSGDSEGTTAVEAVPSEGSSPTDGSEPAPDMSSQPGTSQPMDEMDHASDSSTPEATPSEDGATSDTGEVDTDTAGDTMSACREVYAAQEQPLADAVKAMGQWEVHVGAMNKLVVGAITLAQATDFWNRTRVGAKRHLRAFASSDGEYQQRTTRCPPPAHQADDPLGACQRGVADRHQVLLLARSALDTWGHHVMHMEMLRDGTMTPARATELWLRSWKAGQRQIDAYRSALTAARGAAC